MVFIIMLYSTSMPILYLAGVLMCLFAYWSDKILFLRYYRKPPVYGDDLATRSMSILKYAIVLHLLFGFYMISNPNIFAYR